MTRMALQLLAGTVLVLGTFWNLHRLEVHVGGLEPRAEEAITAIENEYRPIEYWLITNYPGTNRLGYITPLTLAGLPPDDMDDIRWSQLRYVMIPRNLVRGTDETFVIGSFKAGEPVPTIPDSLVEIYNPGKGLVLYKQKSAP
jgi:hypothetical protein